MLEDKLQELVRKPFYVKGIQVTKGNMASVAEWCQGEICKSSRAEGERLYIKVPVVKPKTERQKMAFAGDWVLKARDGFKVYTQRAFEGGFNYVEEKPCGRTEYTADHKPCVLGAGHITTSFALTCRSLTDYVVILKQKEDKIAEYETRNLIQRVMSIPKKTEPRE